MKRTTTEGINGFSTIKEYVEKTTWKYRKSFLGKDQGKNSLYHGNRFIR